MLRATQYRIYPTKEQQEHLAKSFGCCRFAWNYGLALTNQTYKETGRGLSRFEIQRLLPNSSKSMNGYLNPTHSACKLLP